MPADPPMKDGRRAKARRGFSWVSNLSTGAGHGSRRQAEPAQILQTQTPCPKPSGTPGQPGGHPCSPSFPLKPDGIPSCRRTAPSELVPSSGEISEGRV